MPDPDRPGALDPALFRGEAMTYYISNDCTIRGGRRSLIPGYFDGYEFTPHDNFSPGMITPLAHSNAYIITDGKCELIKKDSRVKIISTRFSFNSKEQKSLSCS
ncbi:MAG: hypothetical protein PHX65_09075 [Sulfurimonas sp.]|nr:hypothetical protein [Sulfurimonas sp.]